MLKLYCDNVLMWESGTNDKNCVVISPVLNSEWGKVSTLSFTIPSGNYGYESIHLITSRIKLVENGEIIFYGRPVSAERMFSKMKKIVCEESLGFLRDIENLGIVGALSYAGTDGIQNAFDSIINDGYNANCDSGNRIQVGSVVGTNSMGWGANQFKPESNGLGALGLIQDVVNLRPGQLRSHWVEENGVVTPYIDYTKNEDLPVSGQDIQFGRNLLDLDEQIDGTDLFTVLRFYDSDNDVTVAYQDDAHVLAYGTIQRRIEVSGINERWTTPSDGRTTEARRYYNSNAYGLSTISLNAVDLSEAGINIDSIVVGSKHNVISKSHGVNTVMQCTKVQRKLDQPGRSAFSFGTPKETLTKTLVKSARSNVMRG